MTDRPDDAGGGDAAEEHALAEKINKASELLRHAFRGEVLGEDSGTADSESAEEAER